MSTTLLIGPFSTYHVVVEGRVIPRLTGRPVDEKIELIVDGRFSATFWPKDAEQAAWLIAQALAIGSGYTHVAAELPGGPFAPQAREINVEIE